MIAIYDIVLDACISLCGYFCIIYLQKRGIANFTVRSLIFLYSDRISAKEDSNAIFYRFKKKKKKTIKGIVKSYDPVTFIEDHYEIYSRCSDESMIYLLFKYLPRTVNKSTETTIA